MIPVLIDQKKQGLGRNISDLKNKPNIEKLLSLFLEEVQEIEDATLDFAKQKNIVVAEGVWLDNLGKIVGEDRLGKKDGPYRAAISNRISINVADGTTDVMISAARAQTNATKVRIIDYYPAAFTLVVEGSTTVDGSLFKLMENIKPVGTGFLLTNNQDGDRWVPSWRTSPNTYSNTEFSKLHWNATLPATESETKVFLAQKILATTTTT